jgi:tRNA (guanosine-2'-O-)-methyltransferase
MKWVGLRLFSNIQQCFAALRNDGMKIYTTSLTKDAVPLYELDLTKPSALVFGNEHTGVSDEAVALSDGNFIIPQVGMIKSLNISVACAVSVFEAFRQRCIAGMYDKPQLEPDVLNRLNEEWLKK